MKLKKSISPAVYFTTAPKLDHHTTWCMYQNRSCLEIVQKVLPVVVRFYNDVLNLYSVLSFLIPSLNEVEEGILVSPCPFVRLWTESCSLCIFHNTCSNHFIFTHLNKKLQTACCVWRFYSKFKYLICWQLFRFISLTLCCFDLRSNMNQ